MLLLYIETIFAPHLINRVIATGTPLWSGGAKILMQQPGPKAEKL